MNPLSTLTNAQRRALSWALLACVGASLFHFVHNAEFLDDYPNLPDWLTRSQVYLAWLGVTAVGVLGYVLARSRNPLAGFAVLALYGVLGLDGLTHYLAAPPSAHTATMNLTIGFEAITSLVLLCVLAICAGNLLRRSRVR